MFEQFFSVPSISKEEILLFTTFVLDEAVLVSLLVEHGVSEDQRIIVYHDILRHRSPGYLVAHFPNATVCSVILQSGCEKQCPVFHSKLWARIKGEKLKKIAVTSANLSAYHLVKAGEKTGSWETFMVMDCRPNQELPNSFIFSKIEKTKKHKRLKKKPETLLIDTRRCFRFGVTDKKVFQIIQQISSVRLIIE